MHSCKFSIAAFQPIQEKHLQYNAFNIGKTMFDFFSMIYHIEFTKERVHQFELLDNYRQMLGTQHNIPVENYKIYAEYIRMLQTMTEGVDISPNGANLSLKWNGATFQNYVVDFELFSMGYNIVLDSLERIQTIDISTLDGVKSIKQILGTACGIYTKILGFYHDEFATLVTREQLNMINNYINTYHIHLQVVLASMMSKPTKEQRLKFAMYASAAADSYKKNLSSDGMAEYFSFIAHIFMSLYYLNDGNDNYGLAIAYGQKALSIAKHAKKKSKKNKNNYNIYSAVLDSFQKVLDDAIRSNDRVYCKPVPKDVDAITFENVEKKCPSTFNFNVDVDAKTIHEIVIINFSNKIKSQINNIKKETEKALKDINEVIHEYPIDKLDEINALISEVFSKRCLAEKKVMEISSFVYDSYNFDRIDRQYPNCKVILSDIVMNLNNIKGTEEEYENKLAIVRSLLQSATDAYESVKKLETEINGFEKEKDKLYREIVEFKNMQIELALYEQYQNDINTFFEKIAEQNINPVFQNVANNVKVLRDAKEKVYPNFMHEFVSIVNGLQTLKTNYDEIYQSIISLYNTIFQNDNMSE